MKLKFLGSLLVILSLSSCNLNQVEFTEPHELAVIDYVEKNQKRFPDYNAISFGEVDTVYLAVDQSDKYKNLNDEILKLEADSSKAAIMYDILMEDASVEELLAAKNERDSINKMVMPKRKELYKYKANYEPQVGHLLAEHTFLKKDDTVKSVFKLDTALKVLSFNQTK